MPQHLEQAGVYPISTLLPPLFLLWCCYWIVIFIYRAYFSPLAKFPGPKLAAATFWYEFYYELYPHKFKYLWRIKELHEQYGPIVRINPIHLHIHDHDYFDTVYAGGNRKRNRCTWYVHAGAKSTAGGFSDVHNHDEHRIQRRAVEPFFSKRSVHALEHTIVEKVEKVLSRFSSALTAEQGSEEKTCVVNLSDVMSALAMDVISEYCFGEAVGTLEREDFGREFFSLFHQAVQIRPIGRQFPTLINTVLDLPPWITAILDERTARFTNWLEGLRYSIDSLKAQLARKEPPSQRTVFYELLEKDLPSRFKETAHLKGIAANFLGAGTETTARTLAVTCYYILQNPEILESLRTELMTVMPTKYTRPSLPTLEALPYLSAVINEGLRCAHGVSSRQPRIPVDEDLQYRQWTIPKGTPVMESLYLLHMDPTVFPEPFKFNPQRWIDNPKLSQYQLAFSRGSMLCLGKNLATAELYLMIAYLIRLFELKIWDTIEERDVLTSHDCVIGMTDLKSEGVKVMIHEEFAS